MRTLPSGTVTFLFTDIEGSTSLLHERGAEAYATELATHRRALRDAFARHGGVEVDTEGDAFFVAFPDAAEAVAAAEAAQAALASGAVRVRMGLHTGTPHVTEQGYVGIDVHKGARITAAAHGGQVVLSKETRSLLGEAVALTDLGEHRLKDFAEPIWLYQLGSERFPPLRTISNTNLPRPASSFVGREREVGEIGALLRDGARLLTLTGPGGTGKTRLAVEASAELVPSFRNGVFWVGLAALREPALVPEAIGQTLGAKGDLAEHIGEREMLLLVDNLEQVLGAAPVLASLVEACPRLRLLLTSRERLRVRGEIEYPVPPLGDEEAVTLFCERAGLAPDESIAELCRRLDDVPLAVELAAARTNVLSPRQILERLSRSLDELKGGRDADPRQLTLRATMEWSHELLAPEEQRLFARLSVFRGGWTLVAADAVADADLDVLASLVDKSLVRRGDERFSMLETIREFAVERLDGSGERDALRRRHAEYFIALVEEASPHLAGGSKQWLDTLEREHDNLRAAFDWSLAAGETQAALRMVGALFDFYMVRGHYAEASLRAEAALAAESRPTRARAQALNSAAVFADIVGRASLAKERGDEALRLSAQLGDARGVALARHFLGGLAAQEQDWVAARDIWQECVDAFTALGDDHSALMARRSVAWAYEEMGDLERYRELVEENLRQARAVGDRRIESRSLGALAMLAVKDGRLSDALDQLNASYAIDRELANPLFAAVDLVRFALIIARQGRPAAAAQLVASSDRLRDEIGATPESWMADERAEALEIIRGQLDEVAFGEALQQGGVLTLEEAVALALDRAAQPGQ